MNLAINGNIYSFKHLERLVPDIEIMQHRLVENGCSIGAYKPQPNLIQVWNPFCNSEWIEASLESVEEYLTA